MNMILNRQDHQAGSFFIFEKPGVAGGQFLFAEGSQR